MDVLTAGITDIWSAIRNTCVAKLSKFVEVFTLSQVEEFYNNLVQVLFGLSFKLLIDWLMLSFAAMV